MKRCSLSQRVKDDQPKRNLDKFLRFIAPKPGEEDLFTVNLTKPKDDKTKQSVADCSVDGEFIPYKSERDNLGRLKQMSSRRSTQPNTVNNIVPSLPKLQQSIYNNMKREGITEPLNLQEGNRFKVVDGFERQINIIIRNKEFMSFLKDEKSIFCLTREEKQ